jgi:hypothetical protein
MSGMWKYLIAIAFTLHGLIHALGFAATWQIGSISAVSSTPTLIGDLSEGGTAVRVIGLLWLASLIGFVASAGGLAGNFGWWRPVATAAAVLSLALCLAWWTDAKAGVVIDLAILAGLAVTARVARPATA